MSTYLVVTADLTRALQGKDVWKGNKPGLQAIGCIFLEFLVLRF